MTRTESWEDRARSTPRTSTPRYHAAFQTSLEVGKPEQVRKFLGRLGAFFRTVPDDQARTFSCVCQDTALIRVGDGDTVHGEYRPCHVCNPRGHVLWLGGHWKPDHQGCDECAPAKRRRAGGTSHYDEQQTERAERNEGYRTREREDLF